MQYKHTCIHVHIIVYISVSWGEKITFFFGGFSLFRLRGNSR